MDLETWDDGTKAPENIAQLIVKLKANDNRILMYTGSISVANGLMALIEVADLLKKESLAIILIGDGYELPLIKSICVEKSLKVYLYSFRNKGSFHETCTQTICDDLVSLLNPHYLEVIGEFTPRGGISIFPFVSYADQEHQELYKERRYNYIPGKYSMSMTKIYG